MTNSHFDNITLLVTHYNRSASLERLLSSFEITGITFKEIIISDDCSSPEHLSNIQMLQKKKKFRLITTSKNKGLGNNINKGQDEVTSPYTLYIQEDFEPSNYFKEYLNNAITIMEEENKWDIIRFYSFSWANYPYLKEYKFGFSQMIYKSEIWYTNHLKFYLYSDHPHLRRSSFFEKFGRYAENKVGDVTEYEMCLNFLKKEGKGLIVTDSAKLFVHENSNIEPSTMKRSALRMSTSSALDLLRFFYLKYKVLNSTIKLILMRK